MKQIMMVLAIAVCSHYCAEAQTKVNTTKNEQKCVCKKTTKHTHKTAVLKKNTTGKTRLVQRANDRYQVCEEKGGYYVCCMHNTTTLAQK